MIKETVSDYDNAIFPLLEDWIPPVLKVRRREFDKLAKSIQYPIPSNYWIYGYRGLGKTLTVKEFYRPFLRNMPETYHIYYPINKSRVKGCITELANRTTGKKTNDVNDILNYIVENKKAKKYVFIFDDLQRLTQMYRDFSMVLIQIYDFFKSFSTKKVCQIILISQLPFMEKNKYIKADVQSRLQFQSLMFSQYTKKELVDLYLQRLEYIIPHGHKISEILASEVFQLNSDFRYGLNILRKAKQEYGTINFSNIEKSIETLKTEWVQESLLGMFKPHEAFIYYLLAQLSTKKILKVKEVTELIDEGAYPSIAYDDVKKIYLESCKKIEVDPMCDTVIWNCIDNLYMKRVIDKIKLSRRDPLNYRRRSALFIKIKELGENIANVKINWGELLQ